MGLSIEEFLLSVPNADECTSCAATLFKFITELCLNASVYNRHCRLLSLIASPALLIALFFLGFWKTLSFFFISPY